ncbi:hypothetical protein ACTMTI_19420 [Nonomuraea sp. H19]|uniref:hypothetical protein n=1 Tax=Nonomuraea sp. H19 TaxID=3452206 RepID=UPI003F898DCC
MVLLGILLMVQGFGALIADHFFGKSFGLLNLWLDGGMLTAAGIVTGLAGLVLTVVGALGKDD